MKKDKPKWISTIEDLPKLNEEYLIVWNLSDGGYPVVSSMDFNLNLGGFTDPRNNNHLLEPSEVLFWRELPPPPKIKLPKTREVISPISVDEMERLAYGQCVHGENLANCQKCNPEIS